ncbi:histidine kinase [Nonomuraea sp. NPDC005983]|uniref:sensor histidine kinase n=1 Tax=Nonomuraea sp. NPDC005983 TaxID=3155595 RepID=UPI0033B3097A
MFSAAAAVRPFALALFQGEADPPPRSRRLSLGLPRRLAALLPVRRIALVQAADVMTAWVLFGTTFSQLADWNNGALPRVWDGCIFLSAVAVSAPVALRDRWPLAAWRVALVLLPVPVHVTAALDGSDAPYTPGMVVTYLLVIYSVAVRCDRRIALAVWLITVLGLWIADRGSAPLGAVITGVAVLFGYNVRVRRNATARLLLEERRSRQAESAQAVLEERARIARELHDVVAHHMSVIAIQAEAVPLKAAGDPAQLEAGLAEIRSLSLEAIAELRQVLGVLRDQDGRTDTAPQPGLDRVGELVANARAAGLSVLVEQPEPVAGVPPAIGLSAYRIVQESLSNAMRHAPGATVSVGISRESGAVRLRVVNGPGSSPGGPPGAGQGLAGMRERAALLGGELEAAGVEGGGFQVTARLPIEETA